MLARLRRPLTEQEQAEFQRDIAELERLKEAATERGRQRRAKVRRLFSRRT